MSVAIKMINHQARTGKDMYIFRMARIFSNFTMKIYYILKDMVNTSRK